MGCRSGSGRVECVRYSVIHGLPGGGEGICSNLTPNSVARPAPTGTMHLWLRQWQWSPFWVQTHNDEYLLEPEASRQQSQVHWRRRRCQMS